MAAVAPQMSDKDKEAALLLSMISDGRTGKGANGGRESTNGAGARARAGPLLAKPQADGSGDDDATDAASTLAALEFSPVVSFSRPPGDQTAERETQEPDTMSVTNSPSLGSSCHQCKSRRAVKDLNWCRNALNMQHGKKRPVCRKKYCDRCLLKFLGERPPRADDKKADKWICPACRGICTCAACRRRKNRDKQQTNSVTSSPLSLDSTPNVGSRLKDFKLSPGVEALSHPSPSVKRKRSESLTEVLLARTAALALKTPQSAPFTGREPGLVAMPSLSLGSRAPSPLPDAGSLPESDATENAQQRVAHITIAPFPKQTAGSEVGTLASIQEKLRRLSELTRIGDMDGHRKFGTENPGIKVEVKRNPPVDTSKYV